MPIINVGYHLGVVVSDLRAAMDELSELLGSDWGPIVPSGHQSGPGDPADTAPRMTISRQGPPYIELLQRTPGTVWDTLGLHHIGYWAADARAESERMAAQGFPLEASAVVLHGDTEPGVYYHRTADGLRLELVEFGRGGPPLAQYLGLPSDFEMPTDAA
ncbi:VOC family protein [Nocardia sp. NPDC059240]|uniref:VOC family protein n=1 Tax=Nocardia sp. NPDC059240 TaxID=3346786 RepID=UPI0036B60FC6